MVGDTASLDQDGKPLPGVAQVAMQQGRYAGRLIHRRIAGKPAPRPFRYFDKGNMAVVGKGFAVLQSGQVAISGFLAWLAWAAVHLQFLAQSSLRVSVFRAMGLDLSDGTARIPADRESRQIRIVDESNGSARLLSDGEVGLINDQVS